MNPLYVMPILLISNVALGDWFCTEGSSKLNGNTYTVCGVGESPVESIARSNATRNANEEFEKMCRISDKCNGAYKQVTPLRMECIKTGIAYGSFGYERDHWKCYRALEITIDPTTSTTAREQAARDSNTIASIVLSLLSLAVMAATLHFLIIPLI
jgi:hypothetical protein